MCIKFEGAVYFGASSSGLEEADIVSAFDTASGMIYGSGASYQGDFSGGQLPMAPALTGFVLEYSTESGELSTTTALQSVALDDPWDVFNGKIALVDALELAVTSDGAVSGTASVAIGTTAFPADLSSSGSGTAELSFVGGLGLVDAAQGLAEQKLADFLESLGLPSSVLESVLPNELPQPEFVKAFGITDLTLKWSGAPEASGMLVGVTMAGPYRYTIHNTQYTIHYTIHNKNNKCVSMRINVY